MPNHIGEQNVSVHMSFNNSIRRKETASKFFDHFRSIFPNLEFSSMGQWEPLRKKFDPTTAVEEWVQNRGAQGRSQFGDYIFHGAKPAMFDAFVRWHDTGSNVRWTDSVSVMFSEHFWKRTLVTDMTEKAIRLLKSLSTLARPLYGRGYSSAEFESKDFRERVLKDGRISRESIPLTPRQGIVDLFWLNYFGKPYVSIFGEESLQRVRCLRNERVSDGFLLVFAQDPFRWNEHESLASEKTAKEELDGSAFFDLARDSQPNLEIESETTLDT